ncbi:hypothetical protein JYB64_25060, partial [Algoriphagus aestuarii]|nr:hypothetical protein [Algoriphagus aestuarii]
VVAGTTIPTGPLVERLVEVLEVIVFVRVTVIVTVVLHEAEVDRHLAQRAGHLLSSVVPVVIHRR